MDNLERKEEIIDGDGEDVVELKLDEFNAILEAMHQLQKENSLLDVHVSQLQDRINYLEKELEDYKQEIHKLRLKHLYKKNIKIIADSFNSIK